MAPPSDGRNHERIEVMKSEMFWLSAVIALTMVLWIPYILNRMAEHSPLPALWNPEPDLRPKAPWAERLMRAHDNAVENLVIFAPLVLMVVITGQTSATTASACMVYFHARLAHVILYTFRVPLLRTVAFFVGFLCQCALALKLLGWA
jgi:uncharacterized MAPEG superfamily protein